MIEKVQLNLVNGFEDVNDYYFVVREGDRCWIEGEKAKVVSGWITKNGYCHIGFVLNSGKLKKFLQHRIFMMCFTPNPENKEQVNHIDGNKINNLLSNLEWNTRSENIRHADRTGLRIMPSGENHGRAKLKDSEIPLIFDMRKTGLTQKEIGEYFGVGQMQISRILSGKYRQILC
jgi:hypothetical protein